MDRWVRRMEKRNKKAAWESGKKNAVTSLAGIQLDKTFKT